MKVRIEEKVAFKVAGITMAAKPDSNFMKLWGDLFEIASKETLSAIGVGDGKSYGSCYDAKSDGSFMYMAGYDVIDDEKAEQLNLEILEVPQATYAIFELTGPLPNNIKNGWHEAMHNYFPENGYRHAGTPDFEVYFPGDMQSENYEMELWIPVKKKDA